MVHNGRLAECNAWKNWLWENANIEWFSTGNTGSACRYFWRQSWGRTNDAAHMSTELRLRQLQIKANSHLTGGVTKIKTSHNHTALGKAAPHPPKNCAVSTDDKTKGEMTTLLDRFSMSIQQLCGNHNCCQLSECRSKAMSKPKCNRV